MEYNKLHKEIRIGDRDARDAVEFYGVTLTKENILRPSKNVLVARFSHHFKTSDQVCRRAGDPNKLMFCKRCDGAYHCYCQQPPHKVGCPFVTIDFLQIPPNNISFGLRQNVSTGPYLCPKHTRCHSCGSTVPGSGLSTRWFLGYNYCDACGRLFVKGKYCPVCLKVYRDSESTPMVCCDSCQRWVHCQCDGISDEKYLQFQVDGNLYYKCAACRGECYQVRDHDDAIQELWRRRDNADQEQIASLRAAAGLPSQEEIFSISPYSDDEENDAIMSKSGYGRSLKISVKGLGDKTTKNSKEYGKKSSNKKYMKKKGYKVSSSKTIAIQNFERLHDAHSLEFSLGDERNDDVQSYENERKDIFSPLLAIGPGGAKEKCTINQAGSMQLGFIADGEVVGNNEGRAPRVLHIKTGKSHGLDLGEGSTGRHASKSETVKGTKLVIHLGTRNRNITSSPISEASSCHREQDLTASNGSEDTSQRKAYMVEAHDGIARFGDGKGEKLDSADQLKGSRYRSREGNLIKLGKVKSDFSEVNHRTGGVNICDRHESPAMEKTRVSLGRRTEESTGVVEPLTEGTALRNDEVLLRRHSKSTPNIHGESHDKAPSVSESLPRDPKPLLKLKFKNPYVQNRSSWVPQGEEEKTSIKGQRSKRKRPSPIVEKGPIRENEGDSQLHRDNQIDEAIDANWILKKLGKDAIGKRVEVHQPSDSSWHKGVVTDAIEGTSTLAVRLDDGQANTLELGKQRSFFLEVLLRCRCAIKSKSYANETLPTGKILTHTNCPPGAADQVVSHDGSTSQILHSCKQYK
ncbi:zinc finger protein [Macleaya cordata]|uniref:Zinc finger protein n=1 Tax=Macleaya cordata TaxID=56857 RepID=A0A200R9N8_MACCD|nr:zinc finger protein [Macleaya cordata]